MPKTKLENYVGIAAVTVIALIIGGSLLLQIGSLMCGEKSVGGLYGGRGNAYMDF